MRIIAITALMALATSANAEDLTFGLHLGSLHAKQGACGVDGGCNNLNPGLYLEYKGWTAGFYRNSQRFNSAYAGYTFHWQATERVDLALTTGFVTGYKRYVPGGMPGSVYVDPRGYVWNSDGIPVDPSWKRTVRPMVIPSAGIKLTDSTGLRISLLPKFREVNPTTTIHLSLEHRF